MTAGARTDRQKTDRHVVSDLASMFASVTGVKQLAAWVRLAVILGLPHDPENLRSASSGDRHAAARLGVQIGLSMSMIGAGAYVVLQRMGASHMITVLGAGGFAMAVALVDVGIFERILQLRAETETKRHGFASVRTRGGKLIMAALLLLRVGLSVTIAYTTATVLQTSLMRPEIDRVRQQDSLESNRPILEAAAKREDAALKLLRAAMVDKARAAGVSTDDGTPADASAAMSAPYDAQVRQLDAQLADLQARLQAEDNIERMESAIMNCESTGLADQGCPEQAYARGEKERFHLAKLQHDNAVNRGKDLRTRIDTATAERGAAVEERLAVATTAQQQAAASQAAFTAAQASREDAIAKQAQASLFYLKPAEGLTVDVAALGKVAANAPMFCLLQKAALMLVELNALITMLFSRRRALPIKEYTDFVTESEDLLHNAERVRRQRPPLDSYGLY